jgi:asparagine synthase (glutamine-hydrolysing)
VVAVAEAIPFEGLTGMDVGKLYSLKGEIARRGIEAVTGMKMPVFPKRRFQHGAVPADRLRERVADQEAEYRKRYLAQYN